MSHYQFLLTGNSEDRKKNHNLGAASLCLFLWVVGTSSSVCSVRVTCFIPSLSVFTVDRWCFAAWAKVAPDLSFVLRSNWCLFIYRRGDPDQERVQDGTGVQDGTRCRMAQRLYGGGRGSAGWLGVQDGTLCKQHRQQLPADRGSFTMATKLFHLFYGAQCLGSD